MYERHHEQYDAAANILTLMADSICLLQSCETDEWPFIASIDSATDPLIEKLPYAQKKVITALFDDHLVQSIDLLNGRLHFLLDEKRFAMVTTLYFLGYSESERQLDYLLSDKSLAAFSLNNNWCYYTMEVD